MEKLSDELVKIRDKKYNDWARIRPAYISLSVPCIYSLLYFNIYSEDLSSIKYIFTILLGMSSIIGAVFFLYVFLIRDLSRIFPGKILFARKIKPSTKLLLSSDSTFTEETKDQIRSKIKQLYDTDLNKYEDKSGKNKEYTQSIDDVVGRILNDTRFDNILFEYNCIYGFYRNLSAGIFVDIILLIMARMSARFVEVPFYNSFVFIAIVLVLLDIIVICFAYTSGVTFAKKMYNVFRGLNN